MLVATRLASSYKKVHPPQLTLLKPCLERCFSGIFHLSCGNSTDYDMEVNPSNMVSISRYLSRLLSFVSNAMV